MLLMIVRQISNKLNYKYKKSLESNTFPARIIFVFFLNFIVLSTAYGQNRQVPQNLTSAGLSPGTPAGSYALSGFESVNPFSG